MKLDHLEEGVFDIGVGCCSSNPVSTSVGSPPEIETTLWEHAIISKQSPGSASSSLLETSKCFMTSFNTILPESEIPNGNNGSDNNNSSKQRDSVGRCISVTTKAKEAAQCLATDHSGHGRGPKLINMPSLLDANEEDLEDHVTLTTHSGSRCSESSYEDYLALEVGHSANEYLEECFYTEVSVLNRDKFNAVPETVKSDFAIIKHLGKGSFSDVFEVVCNGGQLFDNKRRIITRESTLLHPRRSSCRSSSCRRSSSINIATLSRPSRCADHKCVFAMKCLQPRIRSDIDQFTIGAEDLVHETAILANLDHRHIIKLHGRATGRLTNAFVLNDGYFILLDKLNETLQDRITTWKSTKCGLGRPKMNQMEVAHSISDAVSYLHSKKIVFRDLKPDNVGFDHKGVVKLFDFGFAIGLPEKNESNPSGFLFDRCGTPRYMAPEVGLSLGYGMEADVYSFAITFWQMFSMTKPFSCINSSEEFNTAVFKQGKRPKMCDNWPSQVKELIGSSWSATPSKRPTMMYIKRFLSSVVMNKTPNRKSPTRTVRSRLSR
mmetsp:Transcript_33183/g.69821  ORF Transcript_33183/g.69821 Transcript_33183/m.69821 type:complete len:549 (-) Transcript_33183:149-1795(-)